MSQKFIWLASLTVIYIHLFTFDRKDNNEIMG